MSQNTDSVRRRRLPIWVWFVLANVVVIAAGANWYFYYVGVAAWPTCGSRSC